MKKIEMKMKTRIAIMMTTLMSAAAMSGMGAVSNDSRTSASVAIALNDAGIERMKAGDLTAAALKFEEAIAVDPSYVIATHNLGKLLASARQYDRAVKVLENGLEKRPEDSGCLVQLAQIYAIQDRKETFTSILERIAKLPKPVVLRELPLLLLRQGSPAFALQAAARAVLADPGNPVCWFNKGLVEEQSRDDQAAEKSYRKAIELKADYVSPWVNLGNVRDRAGDGEGATAAYAKANGIDANDSFALYNYGRMLVLRGKDVSKGFDLVQRAAEGNGGASVPARKLLAELVDIAEKGAAK